MSRWSKRSQDEKERIKEEQIKLKEVRGKKSMGIPNMDPDTAKLIYKNGGIPIICRAHGWVDSQDYTIEKRRNILQPDRMDDFIVGHCPQCGGEILRAIPYGNLDEMMFLPLVVSSLKQKGRLTDKR